MRVVIVTSHPPFQGAAVDEAAAMLADELRARNHAVDAVRLPARYELDAALPKQLEIARGIALDTAECVIALEFPALAVRHPRAALWLVGEEYLRFLDETEPHGGSDDIPAAAARAVLAAIAAAPVVVVASSGAAARVRAVLDRPILIEPPHRTDWDRLIGALLA